MTIRAAQGRFEGRLPVLMPGRDVKHFSTRFPAALVRVLARPYVAERRPAT
jgi:hypothetical protein